MTHGSTESVRRSHERGKAKRDHYWSREDGTKEERASFLSRRSADKACERIETLTGRHYRPYHCRLCDDWHIRPAKRRTSEGRAA